MSRPNYQRIQHLISYSYRALLNDAKQFYNELDHQILKWVGGGLIVLFLVLALAFHNTTPLAIDRTGRHYDLIQISSLSHLEPVYAVFEAKEPVAIPKPIQAPQYVSFVAGNDYEVGQCVYGVATWTRVPAGLGDAHSWGYNAAAMGFKVTSTPTPGSVGVSLAGTWGHVVLVLSVSGSQIYLREQNYDFMGSIRERWANATDFQQYIVF